MNISLLESITTIFLTLLLMDYAKNCNWPDELVTFRENKNPYSRRIKCNFHSSVVFDHLDFAILPERSIV